MMSFKKRGRPIGGHPNRSRLLLIGFLFFFFSFFCFFGVFSFLEVGKNEDGFGAVGIIAC